MPANHRIDTEAHIIITSWEGDAIDSDFIEALKNYQDEIQSKPEYHDYNELVDMTKASRMRLSAKGLINIGKVASSTDQYRGKTKLAILVSSELAYNFSKLYATYRNFGKKRRKQIRAFKKKSDALEWLNNL